MPSPESTNGRTQARTSKTPSTSRSPGHRPVQEPTGAREQHEDNDDPMLLNPDYGEKTPVYEPGETSGVRLAREPNVALGKSFGKLDIEEDTNKPTPDQPFTFADQESRDTVAAQAQRGLVAEGGGHSHGAEAQVGARLDDLQKQSPEQRKGTHQPRGDMPRGK